MREKIVLRVSVITITMNIVLAVFKLFAGIITHSNAMISDAVHSASDVLSTFIVMAGIKIGGKKSDSDHPYGHERFENAASLILAVMLFATGVGIGIKAIKDITGGAGASADNTIAIIAAVMSIGVKEWMYWYTRIAAKKINSEGLMADAWHHRSDAFSSVGSLIGVLGARFGIKILDPIAGIIICCFIIKIAISIFIEAINKMVDKSCDKEIIEKMTDVVNDTEGVIRIDLLNTRVFGSRIFVDIEISVDAEMSLKAAHAISQNVHDNIEKRFKSVKHCMVHVNPYP